MLLFMSMGPDNVCELRPPTGPLFILQIINEYEEPWRNDIAGETEELQEKTVPVPLFQPQIPHEVTWV
jgi:hypothetical protein